MKTEQFVAKMLHKLTHRKYNYSKSLDVEVKVWYQNAKLTQLRMNMQANIIVVLKTKN